MKRGMLDACVLSVLSRGDSYGYQLIKDLTPHVEITESTLYPILKRLETAQCLTVYEVAHNGRLRKFYRITQAGRDRIVEFLNSWKDAMAVYSFIEKGCQHDAG